MSGFVVGFGQPDRQEFTPMFRKIAHRGPYLSGIREHRQLLIGQNYLKAESASARRAHPVPVTRGDLSIACDAQIGNLPTLAHNGDNNKEPFRQERVLLDLYQRDGAEMLDALDDAIFAFVISDGDHLFAARDLLGIKTLFYGWKGDTLYLASELKSLLPVTSQVYEFPPGHWMDQDGNLSQFATLSAFSTSPEHQEVDHICRQIRDIIERSVQQRVTFAEPTACLLSGGMDSSVISSVASHLFEEKFGTQAQLPTFAIGLGESTDIQNARIMAEHINAHHHELLVSREQVLEVLSEVIYYLESFDPSLVRSAASNFLISRYAGQQGVQVLLSGEGGDEVFCGYSYLKDLPPESLPQEQLICLGYLHNNAALRLDRMNLCHSLQVVAPLISGELLRYALQIPPEYKVKTEGERKIEKWIFRKAFEEVLPEAITWRTKQEFSQGSGSANFLPGYFEDRFTDAEFADAQAQFPILRSKEELFYFRLFTHHFGTDLAVQTVGQWIAL
ncbi:hypothetical protein GF339_19200 [candidate division KSB3 bacterium]|uniref:asparagine synthase (glutamine-hydrolyzing) n=1 Tax=candidate division KSB3 bacterium TaxID=2044937 RepID=A0A9D5JYT1_9BACT|nr:hypothetical protein [candidate division KSB3 bacterium]MBD3326719.1 hypothetical protein [candidate division KSB3 bacterium]